MLFNDKIFSQIEITESVILELIKTPQMERLKKIHQYGIYYYLDSQFNTTRFEHSLGVYWILKEFNASLKEQITGLLHDISHGVFSHVIDHLYKSQIDESYQDSIHHQSFENNEVSAILKKFNYDPEEICDFNRWKLMDCPLPDICGDRLEYTLADAVTIGRIDSSEAKKFIEGLQVEKNNFIFQDKEIAKKFAELSLWMCTNFWHTDWGNYAFDLTSKVLERAIARGVIKKEELFTSYDNKIIKKLEDCSDQEIIKSMLTLKNFNKDKLIEVEKENCDYIRKKTKMRVIDPQVKVDNQIKRVSELFPDFKEKFDKEKLRVNTHHYFNIQN